MGRSIGGARGTLSPAEGEEVLSPGRPNCDGPRVNQAVLRIYLLILVGVAALVLAVRPRRAHPFPGEGFVRFLVAFALGGALVLFGFHHAGQVDGVVVDGGRLLVRERFEGRAFGALRWTAVDLETGEARAIPAPSTPPPPPPSVRTSTAALDLRPSLRSRLRRPSPRGAVEVGPGLTQAVLALGTPELAVIAANADPAQPRTVFVARYDRDGRRRWRRSAAELGLREGRLRRSAPLPDGDVVLVFSGRVFGFWETLTQAERVIAVRLSTEDGAVRWVSTF